MKIYLSGPMTGYPDSNRKAFKAAAKKIRALGFDVVNPIESDNRAKSKKWEDFLRKDIPLLVGCQGIALLPGWTGSKGSRLELYIAVSLDIPVYHVSTMRQAGVGIWSHPGFVINGVAEGVHRV